MYVHTVCISLFSQTNEDQIIVVVHSPNFLSMLLRFMLVEKKSTCLMTCSRFYFRGFGVWCRDRIGS